MSDESKYSDEEELRRAVRAEIEQRDLERIKAQRRKESQKIANEKAALKRRIYREEMERYYADRPGYKKIIGEDGEPEWVHEDEIKESEGLVGEVFEDPFEARKKQKLIFLLYGVIFLVILGGVYYLLHQGNGSIQVTSNVPHAHIILDAEPTQQYTNDTIMQVPAGEHFVTVRKKGYHIVGEEVIQVDVSKNRSHLVAFVLEPDTKGDQTDSLSHKGAATP